MIKRFAALAIGLVLLGLALVGRDLYRPYRGYVGSEVIVVSPGTRAPDVGSLLVARGVLAHRGPFLLRYWLGRRRKSLKSGEYLFDRPLRPIDVYWKLVRGEVYLHTVVIPEGSDRFDVARILHQQLGVSPEAFLAATELPSLIRDLDPRAPTLEGYLYPDTYRFARGLSAATVVSSMLHHFRHVIDSRFGQELRQSPGELHDILTLASLVEKETPVPAERAVIAGVFVRRLEGGWPLQCDPTVIYAARLNHRPIRPIAESDLEFDSPFNTYRITGLPPGPICSPGEAAIRAALRPASGDVLYFVSDNRGRHSFAKTLAEHRRNVARYRRQLAQLRQVVPNSGTKTGTSIRKQPVRSTDTRIRSGKSAQHTE